jgi:hypothetical protein
MYNNTKVVISTTMHDVNTILLLKKLNLDTTQLVNIKLLKLPLLCAFSMGRGGVFTPAPFDMS